MVSARRLSTRVTRFNRPSPLRTNVVPDGLNTRGGHTDTIDSPDLRCSLRICIAALGSQPGACWRRVHADVYYERTSDTPTSATSPAPHSRKTSGRHRIAWAT